MSHTCKFDVHVHSVHSKDGKGSVRELAEAAMAAGLCGFALTDHDSVAGHAEIEAAARATGQCIVAGSEVTTAEGHVLALGIREPIQPGMGFDETVAAIATQGGLAIPAHPLRIITGMGPQQLRHHHELGRVDVVESLNARERRLVQQNTQRLASSMGLPQVGGSDAHWVNDIGTSYTVLNSHPNSPNDVLEMMRDGLCQPEGTNLKRRQVYKHGISTLFRRS